MQNVNVAALSTVVASPESAPTSPPKKRARKKKGPVAREEDAVNEYDENEREPGPVNPSTDAEQYADFMPAFNHALDIAAGQITGMLNEYFENTLALLHEFREEQRRTRDAVLGLTYGDCRKRSRDAETTLDRVANQSADLTSTVNNFMSCNQYYPSEMPGVPQLHASRAPQLYRPPPGLPSFYRPPTTASPPEVRPDPQPLWSSSTMGNIGQPSTRLVPSASYPPSQSSTSSSPLVGPPSHGAHPPGLPSGPFHREDEPALRLPDPSQLDFVRALPAFPSRGKPATILQPATYQPAPDDREEKMRRLHETYGTRIQNMTFWWFPSNGCEQGEWIPHYAISHFTRLQSVWHEWDQGKDGCLPVKEIESLWGTKWRPRSGSRMAKLGGEVGGTATYFLWMKTIDQLVSALKAEMNVPEARVILFLESKFKKGAREVATRVSNKKDGQAVRNDLLAAARTWTEIA